MKKVLQLEDLFPYNIFEKLPWTLVGHFLNDRQT